MKDFEERKRREEAIGRAVQEELKSLEKEPAPQDWEAVAFRLQQEEKSGTGEVKPAGRIKWWRAASVAAAFFLVLAAGIYVYNLPGDDLADGVDVATEEEQARTEAVEEDREIAADREPQIMEQPVKDTQFQRPVPGAIGEFVYTKTLEDMSTEELICLLYTRRDGDGVEELRYVQMLPPYEIKGFPELGEERWEEEFTLVEEAREAALYHDSRGRPLLLWEEGEKTHALWAVSDGITAGELRELKNYF